MGPLPTGMLTVFHAYQHCLPAMLELLGIWLCQGMVVLLLQWGRISAFGGVVLGWVPFLHISAFIFISGMCEQKK